MAGSIILTNTFQNESGDVAASQLDVNFGQLSTALNTLSTFGNYYNDSGAVNALLVNVASPQIATYTAGLTLAVKVAITNTGASTLTLNSLGSRSILTNSLGALPPGAMVGGSVVLFIYDGSEFLLAAGNAVTGSTGTFTATATNWAAGATTTMHYYVANGICTLWLAGSPFTGSASNGSGLGITGLPVACQPPTGRIVSGPIVTSLGAYGQNGTFTIGTSILVDCYTSGTDIWGGSGGLPPGWSISYPLIA